MLEFYKASQNEKFQYIIVDNTGTIKESDNGIFSIDNHKRLQEVHPFFEIFTELLVIPNETYEFSCINLNFETQNLVVDINVKTQDNSSIVIIENLTKHYNNYQLAAQSRNESIINSQIIELKNEYLLEKEKFKNNFIANFSHELRNPLTASLIFGNLLSESALNAEQKGYLNIIKSANSDLKQKIEDILDIAKIESGKLALNTSVFSLKAMLQDIVTQHKTLATNKQLEFVSNFDTKLPEFAEGDAYRIKQIFDSLLANAIDFTNSGRISLHVSLNYTRAQKANVQVKVIDTGCGIAPKHHDTIFERFMKIEPDAQSHNGSGLGLAIVKYLITEMGGTIRLDSLLNEGSTFTCNFNVKISSYNSSLKHELLDKQTPERSEKQHILLLEDSELMQLTLLKILAATGQFYVSIISKGEDLISNIIDKDVDLILSSNTIQGFSIADLTTAIRSLPREYKKTPVIALSTEAYKHDIKRFKKAGVTDVIIKPFDEQTLLERINKALK
jgi:signal transduction histidine kinase/CheY-like chemotaxis protein